jgi:hypothetical protein
MAERKASCTTYQDILSITKYTNNHNEKNLAKNDDDAVYDVNAENDDVAKRQQQQQQQQQRQDMSSIPELASHNLSKAAWGEVITTTHKTYNTNNTFVKHNNNSMSK